MLAFNKTGFMFEKYDAEKMGQGGGGGEYVPQTGFGWTNGVVLVLLDQGWELQLVDAHPTMASLSDLNNGAHSSI